MSPQQKKRPVLIVDDQPNWRNLLCEILEDEFDVKSASNYDEALRLLSSQTFHVVVTDQRLKDEEPQNEDGLALFKKFGQMTGLTKFIILTGYPTYDAANRAMGEYTTGPRAFAYLEKGPEGGKFDEIKFKEFVRKAADAVECANNAFVLMPFAQEFNDVFECIKESLEEIGISCTRADDTSQPGIVIEQIIEGIQTSKIIIADVTCKNPNVYFEMGLAHATPRNVILVTQSPDDVSKKIGITRYIKYETTSWGGARKFGRELQEAAKQIQGSDKTIFEPRNLCPEGNTYVALVPTAFQQTTYDKIIQPTLQRLKFRKGTPILDIQGTDQNIVRKLWNQIESAPLVITDLSDYDVDVYYLAGFAYGRGKKQIFMIREGQNIPFDTRAWEVIEYSTDISTVEKTREKIQRAVQEIMPEIGTTKKNRFRILFLAAEPTDQVRLRLGQEFREIQEEIVKSSQRNRLHLELPQCSLRDRDFTGTLLRTNAQILHFSGHGSNRGELCFEADDGSSQKIDPQILADAFASCEDKIKCVILNACYSEIQARAIAKHIDYVVGMRTGISDEAAIKFSIGFYQALGEGRTIEQAFQNGKRLAGLQNPGEYDTPVLIGKKAANK